VQKNQGRISAVLTTYHHPLNEFAQSVIADFRDAAWKDLASSSLKKRCLSRIPHTSSTVPLFMPSVRFADVAMAARRWQRRSL
jgi:hypothetical protein